MTYHHQRRLDRALYHLENLEEILDAWLDENPYKTWSEPDADSTKKLLWVEVVKPPPSAEELSPIIGDCIHNLRSALDNLAFELALAHTGASLSSKIEGDSGFPILRIEDSAKLDKMLKGVHPDAKAIIEGLQPYNRWKRATNDPLWLLNKLDVEDKHRLPHVTLLGTASLSFWVHSFDADEIEPLFPVMQEQARAPVARYPAVDATGAEVDELTPNLSIVFGDRAPKQLRRMPVPSRLSYIHRHIVEEVLPPLVPFLD
jgi:hypothetical protein